MAARVRIDKWETLALREVNGAVMEVHRRARVVGLAPVHRDYRALGEAMAEAGVPTYGETLVGAGFEALVVVDRSAKVIDPENFDVDLTYRQVLEGPNQNLSNPAPLGVLYGKTKCSVVQKATNFYTSVTPFGTTKKNQITVEHTYPESDPNFGGRTITQGGEIQVYFPQRTVSYSGYLDTFTPWLTANKLIASINKNAWNQHGPREWMCTEVAWHVMRVGRYQFGFEFQHNSDTWDPTVVFIDEVTGRPPVGLVANKGYKEIPYHKQLDFNLAFNLFYEGWQLAFLPIIV